MMCSVQNIAVENNPALAVDHIVALRPLLFIRLCTNATAVTARMMPTPTGIHMTGSPVPQGPQVCGEAYGGNGFHDSRFCVIPVIVTPIKRARLLDEVDLVLFESGRA
jgi:hypothetical protein